MVRERERETFAIFLFAVYVRAFTFGLKLEREKRYFLGAEQRCAGRRGIFQLLQVHTNCSSYNYNYKQTKNRAEGKMQWVGSIPGGSSNVWAIKSSA
ncbi:hypothetical protein ACLOJK_032230 [Asimina triloba]